MEFKKIKDTYYLRIDKDEKIVETIRKMCRQERIQAGYFQGIGACSTVIISTYIPENNDFIDHNFTGMIEMISLMGNITTEGNGEPFLHSHAVFSYLDENRGIKVVAGHLKEAEIRYTGEIVLTPAEEKIGRMFDTKANIDVWKLS